MPTWKLLSWNVNGIRAVQNKGFMDWFTAQDADMVFLQETKAHLEQIPQPLTCIPGYECIFSCGERKGYSGVALFAKHKPLSVTMGFGAKEEFDKEGRIICAEYETFVIYGIYFPNGGSGPERLQFKMDFYDAFLDHAEAWRAKGKEVIVCGDVNTAHKPIDLARPKENVNTSGFMPIERAWVDTLVDHGYVDTLRIYQPETEGLYSYWDQRFRARDRNVGWRIDYFFVTEGLKDKVKDAFIQSDVLGSDHCSGDISDAGNFPQGLASSGSGLLACGESAGHANMVLRLPGTSESKLSRHPVALYQERCNLFNRR
jgi:exodeoxyribonuclease-3